MTIVLRGGDGSSGIHQPLTCSTTQRARPTGTGTRFGGGRYRRAANSIAGAGSSTLGGQPLAGADPNSSKKDIKHRFEISTKLGSGTYGKVSLAYDHKTEREVAVKLIKKSAIENKQDLVRIRREIRIMSMLNHPNIIQIYEVFENKDKIILVMEYANGGELYDYVSKNGSLPEAEARRIFRQITSAVLYCHKNKVAHRDLKLENILLDAKSNAKIADFGLSNYFGQKNKLLTTFCGSPLYASPEIINGTPYKGPEVDCWSLGILLYTLVYGSMPFDGRDFNRMVRQIKRGAYYEPDTPSTASMLIRNMLRVNPERRATIYDIASHWWLNLEENMPVIQELPENQITDPTPLTERAEIMVVQELADETDVFMEFGHLSQATRRKIEEFRRRRKEAEEYNENSPIKPPKARKEEEGPAAEEMSAGEKSLRAVPKKEEKKEAGKEKDAFHDPLERLKQLESRLQGAMGMGIGKRTASPPTALEPTAMEEGGEKKGELEEEKKIGVEKKEKEKMRKGTEEEKGKGGEQKKTLKRQESAKQKEPPAMKKQKESVKKEGGTLKKQESMERSAKAGTSQQKAEAKMEQPETSRRKAEEPQGYWRLETDSLNTLMNLVLEQMERGTVSINLIARIKSHPYYDERPEVKELLESIIAAQPAAVQKQTSKLIQQQSKEIGLRQISSKTIAKKERKKEEKAREKENEENKEKEESTKKAVEPTPAEQRKAQFRRKGLVEERRWHSVEVGFSTDSSTEAQQEEEKEAQQPVGAPRFIGTRLTRSEPYESLEEEEEMEEDGFFEVEEDEEEEIDELAEVVEKVAEKGKQTKEGTKPRAPKIVETAAPPETGPMSPKGAAAGADEQHLSTLERGLAKRVSKGKYQFMAHQLVEMYGRGVSAEAESPPPAKRKIGGPQPRPEHSPILFDKAKDYLMRYPEDAGDEEEVELLLKRQKAAKAAGGKNWLKSQDPDAASLSEQNSSSSAIREEEGRKKEEGKKKGKGRKKEENQSSGESSDEEEEEEEEEEDAPFRPRPSTIIGFRTIQPAGTDGVTKEAPIVQVKPQNSQPQSPVTKSSPPQAPSLQSSSARRQSPLAKSPSPHYKAESPPMAAESPIQIPRYETAAAYIRRKNRERRARNATVAVTEDTWTRFPSVDQPNEPSSPRRKGSTGSGGKMELNEYSSKREPTAGQQQSNYSRQTYLDRRKSFHEMSPPSDDAPYDRYAIAGGYFNSLVGNSHVPTNISRYEEEVYNAFKFGGGGANNLYSQPGGGLGPYAGRERERERFEVYKTMAERASEFGRNDMSQYNNRMAAGGSCYYPGERPLSSYAGGAINLRGGSARAEEIYGGGYGGRRGVVGAFETDRPELGNENSQYGAANISPGYFSTNAPPLPEPESPPRENRFRRRISGLRDADGRRAQYATRSQSNDHLFMLSTGARGAAYGGLGGPDEIDQIEPMNSSRYTTPEIGMGGYGPPPSMPPDYGYVAYHDSAMPGGLAHHRASIGPVDGPVRGILKNRQAYEMEPRTAQGQGPPFGRFRRHLSVEKSYGLVPDEHPQHQFPHLDPFSSRLSGSHPRRYGGSTDHLPGMMLANLPPSYQSGAASLMGPSYGGAMFAPSYDPNSAAIPHQRDYDYEPPSGAASSKKRGSGAGLMNLARRRTTEVRLGPEAGLNVGGPNAGVPPLPSAPNSRKTSTNGLLEEELKRPRSPIECIKSLFRGGQKAGIGGKDPTGSTLASSNLGPSPGVPSSSSLYSSRFSTAIGSGTSSSPYGGSSNYGGYGAGSRYGGTGGTIGGANGGYGTTGSRFGSAFGGGGYSSGGRSNGRGWPYEGTHL